MGRDDRFEKGKGLKKYRLVQFIERRWIRICWSTAEQMYTCLSLFEIYYYSNVELFYG